MKSNYVVRATKFMESFFPYMLQYKNNINAAVNEYNKHYHRAVRVCEGAVRRVLITSDYVVKWDYNKGNSKCFGGCREEYKKYQKIKNDYYSYLFAEITPVEIRGYTFYVMPRVNSLGIDHNQYIDEVLTVGEYEYVFDVAEIGDVHDENWGYLKGQVKIIDYACGYM